MKPPTLLLELLLHSLLAESGSHVSGTDFDALQFGTELLRLPFL